jgi:hypothetical protein
LYPTSLRTIERTFLESFVNTHTEREREREREIVYPERATTVNSRSLAYELGTIEGTPFS